MTAGVADTDVRALALRSAVVSIATALNRRFDEMSDDIREVIRHSIPELRGDPSIVDALAASVEANVMTVLHVLEGAASIEEAQAPPAAMAYARRLAQQGVSQFALLRSYRLGHARFLRWCFMTMGTESPAPRMCDAAAAIVDATFAYVDQVSEQVVNAYETERDRWSRNRAAVRRARVRALLSGDAVDTVATERVLNYRLRQHHVGVVVWCRRYQEGRGLLALEQAVGMVAQCLGAGSAPLFIPYDDTSGWGWLGSPSVPCVDQTLRNTIGAIDPSVSVAVGEDAADVTGFGQTHREAVRAQSVAMVGGSRVPRVTLFREVAPIAALPNDLEFAREWVRATLGALAAPGTAHERLRETARAFLASGASYTAAAELLSIHKNTVQYRVQKAEELLGRPLRENRIELELALLACHWMGDAVLPSNTVVAGGATRPAAE